MLKMPKIALLLTLMIISSKADNNQTCQTCALSNYGCQICYQNCTTVIFQTCTYAHDTINEAQCMRQCCSQRFGYYTFDNYSMTSCLNIQKDTNAKWVQGAGYYAIMAAGGLVILILLIIIARAIYWRIMAREIRTGRRVIPESSFVNHQGPSSSDFSRIEISDNRVYPANSKELIEDPLNTCCICLDGNTNSITKCGHVFHLRCLYEWCNRRNSCPLCNYKHINESKVFCHSCHTGLRTINMHTLHPLHIGTFDSKRCDNCIKQ